MNSNNNRMIAFLRSYLSEYDSRVNKYFECARIFETKYIFIGWARAGGRYTKTDFNIIHRSSAPLGAKWGNIRGIIIWQIFMLRKLYEKRKQISVLHCIDLDTAIAGYIFCRIYGKKFIFDIYDQYSTSRGFNGFLARILNFLESRLARRADLCIIAAEERLEQHDLCWDRRRALVLENVPLQDLGGTDVQPYTGTLHIGYFGVLERSHRGIEDLLALAASRADVHLHIAGYGMLEQDVRQAAIRHDNITYYGPMSSTEGLILMRKMHVIAGLYYLSNPNHAYAAPNKYYEHLMLGRGLLTTKSTPPGHRVETHATGWAISEGLVALTRWITELREGQVTQAATNARALWDARYRDYFHQHYVHGYGQHIRKSMEDR